MRRILMCLLCLLAACKPDPPSEQAARDAITKYGPLLDRIEAIALATPPIDGANHDDVVAATKAKLAAEVAGTNVLGVGIEGDGLHIRLMSCCGAGQHPLVDPPATPNIGKYRVGRGNYSTSWESPQAPAPCPTSSGQSGNHPGLWVRWTTPAPRALDMQVAVLLDDWKRPAAWDVPCNENVKP